MATTKDNDTEDFPERLKQLRGQRTQSEFASLLGIGSQQTYANYEKGRIPKPEILTRIAQRNGVTLEWLLHGTLPKEAVNAKMIRDLQDGIGKPERIDIEITEALRKCLPDLPLNRLVEILQHLQEKTGVHTQEIQLEISRFMQKKLPKK